MRFPDVSAKAGVCSLSVSCLAFVKTIRVSLRFGLCENHNSIALGDLEGVAAFAGLDFTSAR